MLHTRSRCEVQIRHVALGEIQGLLLLAKWHEFLSFPHQRFSCQAHADRVLDAANVTIVGSHRIAAGQTHTWLIRGQEGAATCSQTRCEYLHVRSTAAFPAADGLKTGCLPVLTQLGLVLARAQRNERAELLSGKLGVFAQTEGRWNSNGHPRV